MQSTGVGAITCEAAFCLFALSQWTDIFAIGHESGTGEAPTGLQQNRNTTPLSQTAIKPARDVCAYLVIFLLLTNIW